MKHEPFEPSGSFFMLNENVQLGLGDCLELLKSIPDCSVDSIVTDPPYGLKFMGKKWDCDIPSVEIWQECLRVLKPGGHLVAFAGTRTQHRMACNIEDAGFEIRDMIAWVYGSGFPKSHNLKDEWKGWGTALKPALEPITVARKPFKGTVVQNVLEHGTGAINIDGCRVYTDDELGRPQGTMPQPMDWGNKSSSEQYCSSGSPLGRWPANLIHDGSDEIMACFPYTHAPGTNGSKGTKGKGYVGDFGLGVVEQKPSYTDSGNASRFFYCAKASKKDRDSGLDGFAVKPMDTDGKNRNPAGFNGANENPRLPRRNHHPTVKPHELMKYLCRLITPPNGTVLDPFMGSGSTGKAAITESFKFIGIEREQEYFNIAKSRIESVCN